MDMSQHSTQHETVHLIAHLDELERKLFFVGQQSFKNYKVHIFFWSKHVKYYMINALINYLKYCRNG